MALCADGSSPAGFVSFFALSLDFWLHLYQICLQCSVYVCWSNFSTLQSVYCAENIDVLIVYISFTFKKFHASWGYFVLATPLSACWKQQVDISLSVKMASIKIKAYLKTSTAFNLSR